MAYSLFTIKLKSKMAAYFSLNNNEVSKELLVNKFKMLLNNQGRLAKWPKYHLATEWTTEISSVCSEAATGGVL